MAQIQVLNYDDESSEAIVEITTTVSAECQLLLNKSDNFTFSLISYADSAPHLNYESNVSLFGFLVTNIILEDSLRPPTKTDAGFFSYHIYAKVQNFRELQVRLGDIDIFLDIPLPKDIGNGDIVSFDVQRLDFCV